jgi:NAD(P)-dependent dehydrogenase (short-subunit alcohol dehydrogenase family)
MHQRKTHMNHQDGSAHIISSPHTAVITGGNTGLGFACAKALLSASFPWHVVIACRHQGRADASVKELRNVIGADAKIEAMVLDLASFDSIRRFSAQLKERLLSGEFPPLHGLVCNAGMQGAKIFTKNGFEGSFGVNHLGHYLLVRLLLPSFNTPARIAVVSSGVHDPAQLEGVPGAGPPPAWNSPSELAKGILGPAAAKDDETADRFRRYSTSKLANLYFTYTLAARLPKGITVNAFDPGLMPGTGLAREYTGVMKFLWSHIMPKILPLLRLLIVKNIHSPEESGTALARLINDPELAIVNGKYFEGIRPISSSPESYDKKRADELWDDSAILTEFDVRPEQIKNN